MICEKLKIIAKNQTTNWLNGFGSKREYKLNRTRKKDYPIWTPLNAVEAADTLLKALAEENQRTTA